MSKVQEFKLQIGDGTGNEFKLVEHFVNEIEQVYGQLKDLPIEQITIEGDELVLPITYFDFHQTGDLLNMIMNVYYTAHLNATIPTIIVSPEHKFIVIE